MNVYRENFIKKKVVACAMDYICIIIIACMCACAIDRMDMLLSAMLSIYPKLQQKHYQFYKTNCKSNDETATKPTYIINILTQ